MFAAEATLQQQRQGKIPQLDGVHDSESLDAVQTAEELAQIEADERDAEAMSQPVVLGRAGETLLLPEMREMFDARRISLEDSGLAEAGYVNAEEDYLWPLEGTQGAATSEVEEDSEVWVDTQEDQPGSSADRGAKFFK